MTKPRNPVLLVHGIFRKSRVFTKLSAYLKNQGWSVYVLDMKQDYGQLGLHQLAEQVANYVNKTFAREQPFDLVGLSMGGLVSRYYVQQLGGIHRVQRLITISSPHHGTWMAYLLPKLACVQMRPDSQFLQELNQKAAMLEPINFTSIWTTWDFMIVPPSSSQMRIGKNIKVPVFAHALMVRNAHSLKAIAEALSEPVKGKPHSRCP